VPVWVGVATRWAWPDHSPGDPVSVLSVFDSWGNR